jgi:hypothetical protein
MEQIELAVASPPRPKKFKRKVRLTKAQAAAQGICQGCRSQPAMTGIRTCQKCVAAHKRWREKNRDKVLAIAARYREKNKEKVYDVNKRWRAENPEAQTRHADLNNLRKKMRGHGASVEDYEMLVVKQNGACAICGSTDPKNKRAKRLYVDHCHASGLIRGLLCRPCNSVLGFVGDSVELLRSAIAYLEKSR